MTKPILVGYHPGRGDRAPLEFGLAAASFTGARLIVAAVHSGAAGLGRAGAEVIEEQLDEGWGDTLDRLAEELREQGVDADCRSLPGTSAARALHEAAEELGAGLLVVGSTERGGIGRVVPGSTAQRLMHGAPCPIAVVPRSWQRGDGLRTIGVGYVDTAEGHNALDSALALARRSGAKLRVLSAAKERPATETYGGGDAMTPATRYEEFTSALRVPAEQAVEAATSGVSDVEIEPDVSMGDPADFLIAASEQLDLLICGSRGYGPARAVLLGGVSRRVVSEARCPVIVLARGVDTGLEALVDEGAGAIGRAAALDAASVTDPMSITRVFEAPRERVWREWTEPDRFADWFGGAEGEVPPSSVAMDVRVGGAWRLTMRMRGGEVAWHGEYRELVEPERVVFTLSDQPSPDAGHALVIVELTEVGESRTEMRFEQRGSLSPAQTSAARYGWSRFFDRLAARLAGG